MSNWIKCQSAGSLDLLGSSVFVSLSGWLADVAYSLTYENRTDEMLKDVRFVFPVDDSSAVYRLEAELNGRTIECECREKAEAESAYRAAVDRGLSAAFAAESDETSDLMNFYLGNVSAGGQVRVHMRSLVALEAPERWVAALTIPRVLVPRYSPESGGDKPAASAAAATGGVAAEWLSGLQLGGCVFGGSVRLRQLRCSQGDLHWCPGQEDFSVSGLGAGCDIELTAEFEGPPSGASVIREAGNSGDVELFRQEAAALTCFFDESQLQSEAETPKEFVIVVDCSGSMGGNKMTAAKEALLLFLKSLPRGCCFNIVSFGSSFNTLFPSSQPYSEDKLKEALRLQEAMAANMGGTEILRPLQWVFESRSHECQARVILLTDGEVTNVDQVKDLVLKSCSDGHGSRLFAIGIGHGASTSLVKGVARVGRGRADFVRDGDPGQLRRSVIGLLKAAQQPCVEELQLSASTPDGVSALLGTVPSDLKAASLTPLNAFLLLRPEAARQSVTVTVRATVGGRDLTVQCEAAPPAQSGVAKAEAEATSKHVEETPAKLAEAAAHAESLLVHRAAARLQLKEWADENSGGQRTRSIVALSLAANLVSACTAFVGVDRQSGEALTTIAKPAAPRPGQYRCLVGACPDLPRGINLQDQTALFRARRHQSSGCLGAAAPPPPAQSSGSWFNLGLPSVNPFSWGKKSGSPAAVAKPANPTCESSMSTTVSPTGSSAASGSSDPVIKLAASQNFDGHWEVSDELLTLLSLARSDVEAGAPDGEAPSAWFTALVCAHLTLRLGSRRAEWELLAGKARQFLAAACRQRTVAQLLADAEALIGRQPS